MKFKKPKDFTFSNLKQVYLDKNKLRKIENLSRYKYYIKISKKLYSDILKKRNSLIVLNQTFPFCELIDDETIKYRDHISLSKSIKEEKYLIMQKMIL